MIVESPWHSDSSYNDSDPKDESVYASLADNTKATHVKRVVSVAMTSVLIIGCAIVLVLRMRILLLLIGIRLLC